jgi:hypothetical protein
MKILTQLFNFIFRTATIAVVSFLLTFFLSIFLPNEVKTALEIFFSFF